MEVLEKLCFDKNELAYLTRKGFDPEFIKYLQDFRFTGKIYSTKEGDVIFPTRPVLRVEARIIEAQIIETVLLVDTYDTLKSGIPNAIIVGKEMKEHGKKLLGIRLDSGDLAYLAKESRKLLDEAGMNDIKIAVSNQLDEHVIKSLIEQDAPIDIFGVGTSLVTGSPDAAFDGVYKLAYANGKPRIKLSESINKVTLPHKKQVYRIKDKVGNWIGADAISLERETGSGIIYDPFETGKSMNIEQYQKEPLLEIVMED